MTPVTCLAPGKCRNTGSTIIIMTTSSMHTLKLNILLGNSPIRDGHSELLVATRVIIFGLDRLTLPKLTLEFDLSLKLKHYIYGNTHFSCAHMRSMTIESLPGESPRTDQPKMYS
jgi:hypothetical protein